MQYQEIFSIADNQSWAQGSGNTTNLVFKCVTKQHKFFSHNFCFEDVITKKLHNPVQKNKNIFIVMFMNINMCIVYVHKHDYEQS